MSTVDPSPLAHAEQAKARRDLPGEIGALVRADAGLADQPWAPVRPGDVVLVYLPAAGGVPAYGQTYLAVDGHADIGGHAMLRGVSHTGYYSEPGLVPFYDLWFEAGPGVLTVIRAGAVVHGQPARGDR